jgi:hypothetical protein
MNLGGVLAAMSRASASRFSRVLGFELVSMKRGLVRAGKLYSVTHAAIGHA